MTWPPDLPVVRVRWARPTDRLEEVVAFYTDGLGLQQLGRFEGHAGYDGVLVGLTSVGSGTFFGLVMMIAFPLTSAKIVGTHLF